jgi:septum formation protein
MGGTVAAAGAPGRRAGEQTGAVRSTVRHLVLASGSRYRARLLADHGLAATVDPPEVDERSLDHLLATGGPDGLAVELARRKAAAVAPRHPGSVVLAADQVGVLDGPGGPVMLTKQPERDGAVAQLLAMSGTTHRLVNGVVVLDAASGDLVAGVDVQVVTMRPFARADAEAYVDRFEPWDTAGSYRLEDQELLAPGAGLVASVSGEHPSGVVGLPLPLVDRLLADLGVVIAPPAG